MKGHRAREKLNTERKEAEFRAWRISFRTWTPSEHVVVSSVEIHLLPRCTSSWLRTIVSCNAMRGGLQWLSEQLILVNRKQASQQH